MPRKAKNQDLRDKVFYDTRYVEEGKTAKEIAEEAGTYPNQIRRELIKLGYEMRSRSETQKNNLRIGKQKHPTQGSERSEEDKLSISRGIRKSWKNITDEEYEKRCDRSKNHWESLSQEEKNAFHTSALNAVRESAKNGSKFELYLTEQLQNRGYHVELHKEHIFPNTKLKSDLFIPTLRLVIEVDGPSHFFPIWGEKTLERNIQADQKKNELLISGGYVIMRVRNTVKRVSPIHKNYALKEIVSYLEKFKEGLGSETERVVYIDLADAEQINL